MTTISLWLIWRYTNLFLIWVIWLMTSDGLQVQSFSATFSICSGFSSYPCRRWCRWSSKGSAEIAGLDKDGRIRKDIGHWLSGDEALDIYEPDNYCNLTPKLAPTFVRELRVNCAFSSPGMSTSANSLVMQQCCHSAGQLWLQCLVCLPTASDWKPFCSVSLLPWTDRPYLTDSASWSDLYYLDHSKKFSSIDWLIDSLILGSSGLSVVNHSTSWTFVQLYDFYSFQLGYLIVILLSVWLNFCGMRAFTGYSCCILCWVTIHVWAYDGFCNKQTLSNFVRQCPVLQFISTKLREFRNHKPVVHSSTSVPRTIDWSNMARVKRLVDIGWQLVNERQSRSSSYLLTLSPFASALLIGMTTSATCAIVFGVGVQKKNIFAQCTRRPFPWQKTPTGNLCRKRGLTSSIIIYPFSCFEYDLWQTDRRTPICVVS